MTDNCDLCVEVRDQDIVITMPETSFRVVVSEAKSRIPARGEARLQPEVKKISARNQLRGTVVEVRKGQTTAHVRVDIGENVIVTSSITNEAVDDLGLAIGDEVTAVIKASDVMIAKLDEGERHYRWLAIVLAAA